MLFQLKFNKNLELKKMKTEKLNLKLKNLKFNF